MNIFFCKNGRSLEDYSLWIDEVWNIYFILWLILPYSMGRIIESILSVWKKAKAVKGEDSMQRERGKRDTVMGMNKYIKWIEKREVHRGMMKKFERHSEERRGWQKWVWGPITVPLTFFLQRVTLSFHSTPKYYSFTQHFSPSSFSLLFLSICFHVFLIIIISNQSGEQNYEGLKNSMWHLFYKSRFITINFICYTP